MSKQIHNHNPCRLVLLYPNYNATKLELHRYENGRHVGYAQLDRCNENGELYPEIEMAIAIESFRKDK